MEALTPTQEDLKRIRGEAGSGPVFLLNLLKFRAGDGRKAYGEYAELAAPIFARAGGELIYFGEVGPVVAGGGDWDTVALVRFESIDRFIDLVGDPTYQSEGRALRERALERTQWMVTKPPPANQGAGAALAGERSRGAVRTE